MSNRPSISLALCVFLLFLSGCHKQTPPPEKTSPERKASWFNFRGNAALTGLASEEPSDNPELLWSFPTEGYVISSPVIGFGRVYAGSTDGKIYALDLRTGDKAWAFDTGDDIEAPALLDGDSLYIGNLSGDFFALDAETGRLRWTYSCDNSIFGSANAVPAPDGKGRLLLIGSHDNRLHCLRDHDGSLVWAFETDNFINGTPATDGNVAVFGGCDEFLHIVSVRDGIKMGEVWAGSYIAGSAAIDQGVAYLGHYGNKLVAIDLQKKEIIWEYMDRKEGDAFFSSPAVGKDRILIGSRDSRLHCVDRKSGEGIWTFRTRDWVESSPVLAGDKVIFGSTDGRLYMVDSNNGKLLWSYEIGAALIASPAVTGGLIAVGAEDGRIYLFGDKT